MGLFNRLFGSRRPAGPGPRSGVFVSEQAFRDNLSLQMAMSPRTVAKLREFGVGETTTLRLEFFFYTNAAGKAATLAAALQGLGYEAQHGPAASGKARFLVTGWTLPLTMDDYSILGWTERMVRLGYSHDAEFDGWGTNPRQQA